MALIARWRPSLEERTAPMNGLENSQKSILPRSDGATIAYDQINGIGPGIVFLHGLKSDRRGTKASHLYDHCKASGRPFLTLDMYGHGDSSGNFIDGSITRWTEDAVAAIENLTTGPQILVGSSMGGWIMLKTALERPDRIAGLIGIAAAPDFTETLIWDSLSEVERDAVEKSGRLTMPTSYEEDPYDIGFTLIEDGRSNLLLTNSIPFTGPVHLLHGLADEDVPWTISVQITECLESTDAQTTLVKDGAHNLSRPSDLDLLTRSLDVLLEKVADS